MKPFTKCCLLAWLALSSPIVSAQPGPAEGGGIQPLHRDPFDASAILPPPLAAKPDQATEAELTFELKATLVAKEHPLAHINGQILTVGETIDGYRLRQIGENQVVLEKDGKSMTVSLQP